MAEETYEMDIFGHLEELRATLLRALVGLGVGVIAAFFFTNRLMVFLAQPVGGLDKLQAIEVTESLGVYMRVALLAGIILSIPWVFYQLFGFIEKALSQKEKKGILCAMPLATLLFLSGAAFAFYVMLPASLNFFINFLKVETTLRVRSYFDFVTNLLFWIAVSFELPLIFYLLAKIGLISTSMLIKGWRVAVVIIAILAAVITPTGDPLNMLIFMVPLFVLYLLSIGLTTLTRRKREVKEPMKEN